MKRLLLAAWVLAGFSFCQRATAEGLLIIANPSVSAATPLNLNQVAAIYLLRVTTWPDGTHIVPVNREITSDARTGFTMRVLHEDNETLAAYWNQMHFMGKEPPVVQESEAAMLAFIQKVPGSIGYVSGSTAPNNVTVLAYVP